MLKPSACMHQDRTATHRSAASSMCAMPGHARAQAFSASACTSSQLEAASSVGAAASLLPSRASAPCPACPREPPAPAPTPAGPGSGACRAGSPAGATMLPSAVAARLGCSAQQLPDTGGGCVVSARVTSQVRAPMLGCTGTPWSSTSSGAVPENCAGSGRQQQRGFTTARTMSASATRHGWRTIVTCGIGNK